MNKKQMRVMSIFCFILAGLLLFQVLFLEPFEDTFIEDTLLNVRFYLGIILIGAGIIIKEGSKEESKDLLSKYINEFLTESLKYVREWIKQGGDMEIADRPEIKSLLDKYKQGPKAIRGIFCRLIAMGTGKVMAHCVIETPGLLELYLKMKKDKVSDYLITEKIINIICPTEGVKSYD